MEEFQNILELFKMAMELLKTLFSFKNGMK